MYQRGLHAAHWGHGIMYVMRFEVPQFIEIEDKIFGPLTWKQFIYLAGGAGFGVIAFFLLPFVLFVSVEASKALATNLR